MTKELEYAVNEGLLVKLLNKAKFNSQVPPEYKEVKARIAKLEAGNDSAEQDESARKQLKAAKDLQKLYRLRKAKDDLKKLIGKNVVQPRLINDGTIRFTLVTDVDNPDSAIQKISSTLETLGFPAKDFLAEEGEGRTQTGTWDITDTKSKVYNRPYVEIADLTPEEGKLIGEALDLPLPSIKKLVSTLKNSLAKGEELESDELDFAKER